MRHLVTLSPLPGFRAWLKAKLLALAAAEQQLSATSFAPAPSSSPSPSSSSAPSPALTSQAAASDLHASSTASDEWVAVRPGALPAPPLLTPEEAEAVAVAAPHGLVEAGALEALEAEARREGRRVPAALRLLAVLEGGRWLQAPGQGGGEGAHAAVQVRPPPGSAVRGVCCFRAALRCALRHPQGRVHGAWATPRAGGAAGHPASPAAGGGHVPAAGAQVGAACHTSCRRCWEGCVMSSTTPTGVLFLPFLLGARACVVWRQAQLGPRQAHERGARMCVWWPFPRRRGLALDPVAHFHLRNGAQLLRINFGCVRTTPARPSARPVTTLSDEGDCRPTLAACEACLATPALRANTRPAGIESAYGIMVNYRYDLAAA